MRKTVLSGIQPTGVPHLGNYLGAIKNWVRLQDDYNCIFQVADLHAITVPQDPKVLKSNSREIGLALIACGIDPSKSVLFRQSRIHEHAELGWTLFCRTPMNWLTRMHQVKSKTKDTLHLGLLSYPVLQAADILLYKADLVPVGEDQEQHLNLTTMISKSFNSHYKTKVFKIPKGLYTSDQAKRIMSLKDPTKKMSKSDPSEQSRIGILDSDDQIRSKIKKATTDSIQGITYDPQNRPGVSNLIDIVGSLQEWDNLDDEAIKHKVNHEFGSMKTSEFKDLVGECIVSHLSPIRNKYGELINEDVDDIYAKGEVQASAIARDTLAKVYQTIGL